MTRDGLTEENLRDGSVKDISHRSRGRPENKEEFVPERERKKAENEASKSGKGKRLQMEKIRKSSVRQEAVEDTVEVTPEEKVSGYRKKLHRYEKIPDDDNNLNSQKKSIRKKQLQIQLTKEEAKAGTENNGTFVQNADNEKTDATKSTDAGSTADGKVDINTAGKDELMTLSGIGEAKADAIIRYRDEHGKFQKIEDLMEVEGIKDGVFQKVKDQIKI